MLKETEETLGFVVIIFIIGSFLTVEERPLGFPWLRLWRGRFIRFIKLGHEKFHSSTSSKTSIEFTAGVFFRWNVSL